VVPPADPAALGGGGPAGDAGTDALPETRAEPDAGPEVDGGWG
jgi:hypothetical protein